MITHDTLLRVRETARIDEVAAGYLTLRRSGKDLVALCPFHDERHPSFRISPALNIGKCFSCGEAADPIRLVRHMEGCGFEEAVRLLQRYGFLSLPVVDAEGRLVGIVTVDDAVDVMEQEATEDFEKMAAMAPSERPYLKTGVFSLARHRIVWLLVLMISGMITGGILGRYEAAIAAMPLLVTFIPMLTDTGGNAGSQSSTLVIRGLAVNEITLRDFPRVLWKELRVSLLVGVVLSAVNFVRLILTYPGSEMVALTVALTMLCTVIVAKTIGGVLPLIAKACRMDPAIMASPLITTIVDAVSLVIYFAVAHRLLPL